MSDLDNVVKEFLISNSCRTINLLTGQHWSNVNGRPMTGHSTKTLEKPDEIRLIVRSGLDICGPYSPLTKLPAVAITAMWVRRS